MLPFVLAVNHLSHETEMQTLSLQTLELNDS
jgi:hypothetical protein